VGNGEKATLSTTSFLFRRVVPWFVLLGFVYYIFSLGRTYVNQQPREETSHLVTTETAVPAQKAIAKAKVVSPTLNFRDKPSIASGQIIERLEEGAVLDVLAKPSKEWLRVRTAQGTVGYISSSNKYVELISLKKKK